MSAFLGPIHHWLYNKIEVEETILETILKNAKDKNIDTKELENENIAKYGDKVKGRLEDNINENNIHGWLQERITSVEYRLANTVTTLVNNSKVTSDDISENFISNAEMCAKKIELDTVTPEVIFREIYNYLLAGMPCDRVNEVKEHSHDSIVWETTIDIHKPYWDSVNGNVDLYNEFEQKWIKKFVNTLSSDFDYNKKGNINIIERVK